MSKKILLTYGKLNRAQKDAIARVVEDESNEI